MPLIEAIEIKRKMFFEYEDAPYHCLDVEVSKPTARGGQTLVRVKMRNMLTRAVFDRTFNAGVRVEQALLEKKDMQFLYRDGDQYVFMDTDSYEQTNVAPVALGDAANYLVEQAVAIIAFYQGEIVSVEIPASVELQISDTEPGIQGDRVSGARKPATLETGLVVQVPLFINPGDRVRVDTRSGEYVSRA